MAAWIIGFLAISLLSLVILYAGIRRAPLCSCGMPDCGGGCPTRQEQGKR